MGNRLHSERYPPWSFKRHHNVLPKWLKRLHHTMDRARTRQALHRGVRRHVKELAQGEIVNRWF